MLHPSSILSAFLALALSLPGGKADPGNSKPSWSLQTVIRWERRASFTILSAKVLGMTLSGTAWVSAHGVGLALPQAHESRMWWESGVFG